MLYAVSAWRMDLLRGRGSRPVLLQHYNRETRTNADSESWLLLLTSNHFTLKQFAHVEKKYNKQSLKCFSVICIMQMMLKHF